MDVRRSVHPRAQSGTYGAGRERLALVV